MSKNNQIIIISPPLFISPSDNKEKVILEGHRCSSCHGNGYHWEDDGRDTIKVPCRVCNGTGRLTAEITIEWKASK